jgi:hypothetical protein
MPSENASSSPLAASIARLVFTHPAGAGHRHKPRLPIPDQPSQAVDLGRAPHQRTRGCRQIRAVEASQRGEVGLA